tara:strand:- start:275 stop:391 length:117 start_codon:yes stop_codon:yes gene_type:complete
VVAVVATTQPLPEVTVESAAAVAAQVVLARKESAAARH